MKRLALAMVPLLLLLGTSSCGVSGQGADDVSRVTVRIDGSSSSPAGDYGILAVPAELVGGSILISISGEGMETLEKQIGVQSEQDVIQADFLVPNGPDRRLWVYAYREGGTLLYTGHEHLDLDGTPVSVVVHMLPVQPDTTPPVFPGLEAATSLSPTSVSLSWSPALDDQTPEGAMVYYIYESLSSGIQDFQTPTYATTPGATPCYTATGPYRREELTDRLIAADPDLVLFPSVAPETFSYVLHELARYELPIAAYPIGAQADFLARYPHGVALPWPPEPISTWQKLRQALEPNPH